MATCMLDTPHHRGRRRLLHGAGAIGAIGAIGALGVTALPSAHATSTPLRLHPEFAGVKPTSLIDLQVAAMVDNGAAVPISVSSSLPDTQELIIVVDGNPEPVAARFTIPPGTEPFVATRIKLAGSGTVYAMARTADSLHAVARPVQVVVGGCG